MVLAPGTATKTWKGRQPLWWGAAYHRIDFDSMPVGIRGDKHTFTILYADAPRYIVATYGTPQRFLRVMRDATAEPFPASTILHDRAIHLGRSPGRAFTIALDDHGGVIDARIFLVGERFYELAVGSTPYLCLVDRASSRRFLRSFRLLRPEDYV